MALTKSWDERELLAPTIEPTPAPAHARRGELGWLIGASLVVCAGLALVWSAKTQNFGEVSARLERGELLDLNAVHSREQLDPFFRVFPDAAQRESLANSTFEFLQRHRPLANVGALARVRPKLPLTKLKPLWLVRTPRAAQREFVKWIAIYLGAFYLVLLLWRVRGFQPDASILPALHLLTGMGLILMLSLRDPLRDTLEVSKFAWGVAAGCGILLLPLLRLFSYRRLAAWCYTPLWVSLGLFALLLRFGAGPGESDSKVNLGPFQPVEFIKILLVIFLAGYFARKWERLRDLRQRWINLPRLAHVLPVVCAVSIALALFFILKDLGPALVLCFLFLAMFAVARGRSLLALAGVALMVAGVAAGYRLGKPPTVVHRISMWLSPWDNDVHGGNQLAHAVWAFATGGPLGSGPGWGDPAMIPAGNNDLVLPAIGEEWGFAGVAMVSLLFAFLVGRAFRIALRSATEYGFFLGVGFGCLIGFEMLLISAGVLGAIPLTGVVSPFLSSGNTAMLANFLAFAILASISHASAATEPAIPVEIRVFFARPVHRLAGALLMCSAGLLGLAAKYQLTHDQEFIARETRVFEDDGVKRAQRNPRINSIARELVRGNIYDRNGLVLATSDWNELERRRAEYEKLGISIDQACSRLDNRHYPFGGLTVHVLGDLRTGENFHASNASLVEHDANKTLQGYDDWHELVPLVRYRHQPGNAAFEALRRRDRSVHTSLDIRLQARAAEIFDRRLQAAGKEKGALVIMDARSGEVLAMLSRPVAPVATSVARGTTPTPDELLDRARYGQYPPGSTFKLVTAMAALRVDPELRRRSFSCQRLGDGRVGNWIRGWNRPIRDDIKDHAHGTVQMERAITVSCNAYFAQLGVFGVGAKALEETAGLLDIPVGDSRNLKRALPFAAYGQGEVIITPLKMARVAATVANGGAMPQGRWIAGAGNTRTSAPRQVLDEEPAAFLARAMRSVVTSGTGRHAMQGETIGIAGKTGTAQLGAGEPHSWFAGFAPYQGEGRRVAFAVVVEHGGYGALAAAPVAREVVEAARALGVF